MRLEDHNGQMRDISIRLTNDNPIPSEPPQETPKQEGLLHSIADTLVGIEKAIADYAKIVVYFQQL